MLELLGQVSTKKIADYLFSGKIQINAIVLSNSN